ncbi:MAG: class I SAM-dependent methyltransferase, partial [Anaerolineae bacterium]|nr:class I SAM-dependent methyltransferase [Anaerolineae bacterium]
MTAVPLPDSLDRLLKLADPQPGWRMLEFSGDVATIRHFAPQVRQIVAAGLSAEVDLPNVEFAAFSADELPFPAAAFDLLVCRLKAHQIADAFRFMQAAHRILKPGGVLLVEDILVPEDEAAARYVNAFLKFSQRDHVRAYADYE